VALPEVPDHDVVAGLIARDEATFELIVRTWSPAMLRIARMYVGSTAVAEEVVQETWIAVVKQIGNFEGRAAVRTWALRICANIGRRYAVRERRSAPGQASLESGPTVSGDRFRAADEPLAGYWQPAGMPTEWGPESQTLSVESRTVLFAAVQQLPERQAHVVALRDIHGLGTAEIADLIGTTEGNIRVILHRGRATLRESLAKYFADEVSVR
jgi:RNA polymerase sigma-70 factor (ECF subfamily)